MLIIKKFFSSKLYFFILLYYGIATNGQISLYQYNSNTDNNSFTNLNWNLLNNFLSMHFTGIWSGKSSIFSDFKENQGNSRNLYYIGCDTSNSSCKQFDMITILKEGNYSDNNLIIKTIIHLDKLNNINDK